MDFQLVDSLIQLQIATAAHIKEAAFDSLMDIAKVAIDRCRLAFRLIHHQVANSYRVVAVVR